MPFNTYIFKIPTANSYYTVEQCMQTSFAKLQEMYSIMKGEVL